MSTARHGGLVSRINNRGNSVIRFANAQWMAESFDTGTRYVLFGWDEFEGIYIAHDTVHNSLINVYQLFVSLSPERQKAILGKRQQL